MSKKGENIYKRKDGRWEARYKKGVAENGRIIYGSIYGKTYREVKEKRESFVKSGTSKGSRKKSANSFQHYCDEWIFINKSRVKESTFARYKTGIDKHIMPFFGIHATWDITTELVTEFTNQLIAEKQLSAKTVKDILVLLKSILKYMAKFEPSLSSAEVYIPKPPAKEIRVLSNDEQKKFVEYLLEDMDSCKFGILFALMTGLRIGEICALRAGDISLSDKTVTVRETMQRIPNTGDNSAKTKIIFTAPKSNKSARIVPLTNTAFELCSKMSANCSPRAFLLTGSETKFIEPRVLQYRIKKYSEDCGIEGLHFHVLRHTFATRCVEVGFEIKTLSEVLGHATPQITLERYVHSSLEFKRKNMSKLEALGL